MIVASQRLRTHALTGSNKHIVLYDFSPIQYAMLERLGRARYLGEITHGIRSIQTVFRESPTSMFYHNKKLLSRKLITKQVILPPFMWKMLTKSKKSYRKH